MLIFISQINASKNAVSKTRLFVAVVVEASDFRIEVAGRQ